MTRTDRRAPRPLRPQPRSSTSPAAPPRPGARPVVGCGVYVDGHRLPGVATEDALRVAAERGGFVWLGLHEPTAAEFESIATQYQLHPLAAEDAVHAHQRPKLDRYEGSLFMVLKTASYVEHEQLTPTSEVVDTGEVMVFVGANYVITVRHGQHGGLAELRERLEEQPDLLCQGPSAVLYAVADLVVDRYVEVAAAVEDDVDELEGSVFSPQRTDDVPRLYLLKRELMQLRRAVSPLDLPLHALAERQVEVVPEEMRSYFRDVEDHTIRVRDQVAALDELLSSILQASLARTSLADNEDMRKISAYAGIIAVPTFIAGLYGMNFAKMPELDWWFGYPLCLLLMLVACTMLWRGFKRSGWL